MNSSKLRTLVQMSLFVGLMVICSWITVPFSVPFTLQTFAIFLAAGVLGGKKALAVVAVYILLGALGVPVFSGGRAGIGALFDVTGGYINGFLPCAYLSGILCEKTKRPIFVGLSMLAGLLCVYICGALWIYFNFSGVSHLRGFLPVLSSAMFPYIVPDMVKIFLAVLVSAKLKRHIRV